MLLESGAWGHQFNTRPPLPFYNRDDMYLGHVPSTRPCYLVDWPGNHDNRIHLYNETTACIRGVGYINFFYGDLKIIPEHIPPSYVLCQLCLEAAQNYIATD